MDLKVFFKIQQVLLADFVLENGLEHADFFCLDNNFVQVLEIGSVGKGFSQGTKSFFAHTTQVRNQFLGLTGTFLHMKYTIPASASSFGLTLSFIGIYIIYATSNGTKTCLVCNDFS